MEKLTISKLFLCAQHFSYMSHLFFINIVPWKYYNDHLMTKLCSEILSILLKVTLLVSDLCLVYNLAIAYPLYEWPWPPHSIMTIFYCHIPWIISHHSTMHFLKWTWKLSWNQRVNIEKKSKGLCWSILFSHSCPERQTF